jgi:hypothetical protein
MNEALRTPLAAMRVDPATAAANNVPLCPKCHAVLNFYRSITPDFDSSGFESYRLDCQECGIALSGIIDPADDGLIISECPSPADNP